MKLTGGLRFIKETFMHKKRILLHVLFLVLFLIGIGAAAYPAFGNWYTEQKRSVVLTEYEKALAKIEDADLTDAFKQAEIYNEFVSARRRKKHARRFSCTLRQSRF